MLGGSFTMPGNRKLKNSALRVEMNEDGGYNFIRAPLKGLVLSGGGARGIAYIGMYQELHEQKVINQLSHVCGASAGAMTASLIALGVSPKDFTDISTRVDMKKLVNATLINGRADGSRFRNVLELIYLFQIEKVLKEVNADTFSSDPEIRTEQEKAHLDLLTKTKAYRGALNQLSQDSDINISNLSELITFVSSNDNVSNNFNTLNTALETVPKSTREAENSRFTFKDLTRLRDILPESKKSMVKNLSVSATNKTNHSQVVFNEENEGANQSIAEKVMQSGAHPIMFQAQKDENNHTITDGGILDNMPSGALERLGLTKQEILCVKVNQAGQVADQMRRVRSPKIETPSIKVKAFDFLLSSFLGGEHKKLSLDTREREKTFYDVGNMLFLNSGDITVTTISPTEAQKNEAIESGKNNTRELLEERKMNFTSLLDALLYVGEEELHQIASNINKHKSPEIFKTVQLAQSIFNLQNETITELEKDNPLDQDREIVRDNIMVIQRSIQFNSGLESSQQVKPLALCLKQMDFKTEGKLSTFLENEINLKPNNGHWALRLLLLIVLPIKWTYQLFSKPTTEYQETQAQELNNSEHAQGIKSILEGDDRIFSTEQDEFRNAMSNYESDEDLDNDDDNNLQFR